MPYLLGAVDTYWFSKRSVNAVSLSADDGEWLNPLRALWAGAGFGSVSAVQNQQLFGDSAFYVFLGRFTLIPTGTPDPTTSGEIEVSISVAGSTAIQTATVVVPNCPTCWDAP